MNSKNIQIDKFYRLKNSPNYGYIKPIEILKAKQGENNTNYIVVKCKHTIYTTDIVSIIRYVRLSDIIEDKNNLKESKIMLKEMDIKEFQKSGLLWFINQQLHLFGLALAIEYDANLEPSRLFIAKYKFRVFDTNTNDRGYRQVTDYMINNSKELFKDCEEN